MVPALTVLLFGMLALAGYLWLWDRPFRELDALLAGSQRVSISRLDVVEGEKGFLRLENENALSYLSNGFRNAKEGNLGAGAMYNCRLQVNGGVVPCRIFVKGNELLFLLDPNTWLGDIRCYQIPLPQPIPEELVDAMETMREKQRE